MQKITPCLWFDTQAEDAAKLYTSIFPNSRIEGSANYEGDEVVEVSGKEEGSVMTVSFYLDGQKFMALNGGPQFKFNESISFMIDCKTQEEVDHYWEKLTADGGEESQCGWLKDKFGVAWQVVPEQLGDLMSSGEAGKAEKVMNAMLKMKKLIIADLEAAYNS